MTQEIEHRINNHKPVIFLAFANDRMDKGSYLRNLPQEQRGIREVLEKATTAGLCEIVERSNTTIDDILDVFQSERYKNRIAIFHFGGHADDYQLLLEAHDGRPEPAHREGLVNFLARREGLKFIFLNGCSTQMHAIELKRSGIPAIVGTSQSIKDTVATNLSIRFYDALACGSSIENAWLDAEDSFRIKKGRDQFRELYWEGKQEKEDCFPWHIHFNEGAEQVKHWNLPYAAQTPLYGLPDIPDSIILPDEPFLFLKPYERKHAGIFFGASYCIRELYLRISNTKLAPIILFYGQSGIGKSSLLDAGLLPRLEKYHTVNYASRKWKTGLLGVLSGILNDHLKEQQPGKEQSLAEKWHAIEKAMGKPLVIILDQVEEIYTKPNKKKLEEMDELLKAVKTIFNNPASYPQGKLILSYRKEFHPDVDDHCKLYNLDRTHLFMQPLSRSEIIAVVLGLTGSEKLRAKYHLNVEENLPVIIADDIMEDPDTPVAPVLQIIMTRLWNLSQRDDRLFSIKQYQELRRQGLLLQDFFHQQMAKLAKWKQTAVDSGLALDVLHYHISDMGTSYCRQRQALKKAYSHRPRLIPKLIEQLKSHYLLIEIKGEDKTRLAHDTLAPVIIEEYNNSNRPGQRGSRILKAKIDDYMNNPDEICLDEVDLDIVEQGKKGMRKLTDDEGQLLKKSKERKEAKDKEHRRNKTIRVLLSIFTIIFAFFAALQWRWALQRSRHSEANRLTIIAEREVENDPTIALGIAQEAHKIKPNKTVTGTLQKIFRENQFYKIIATHQKSIACAQLSPDGEYILLGYGPEGKTASLYDLDGKLITRLVGHDYSITSIAFSRDGNNILTASKDKTAGLWNWQGKKLHSFTGHKESVNGVDFSPDGKFIVTASRDGTARLWDIKGNLKLEFKEHQKDLFSASFSPDGNTILSASADGSAMIWDRLGKVISVLKGHDDEVRCAIFSHDGKSILTGSMDNTAGLWDLKGNLLHLFSGHKKRVTKVSFSPDDKSILTASQDHSVRLWDLKGNLLQVFKGHKDRVTAAQFIPNQQAIITASWDQTIRRWNLKGGKVTVLARNEYSISCADISSQDGYILTGSYNNNAYLYDSNGKKLTAFKGHNKRITCVSFSRDEKFILTGSEDKTARLWNLQGDNLRVFREHQNRVTCAEFSKDGNLILTGSWDHTARLWDLQTQEVIQVIEHKDIVTAVQFAPDGNTFLTASWDNFVFLWDLKGNRLLQFHQPGKLINSAAFSPNGKRVVTAFNDGIHVGVQVWNRQGKILHHFKGHRHRIPRAHFSPSGKRILTASWDKSAGLWDLEGNELQHFKGHGLRVENALFFPDEKHILTVSADKTIRKWEVQISLTEFLSNGSCQPLSIKQRGGFEIK
jgi:WD40 repeat protein